MAVTMRSAGTSKPRAVPTYYGKRVDTKNYLNQKLRVCAYCRVSTELEEQQSSFDTQVQFYTLYINNNPNWELVEIYADDGKSGAQTYWRNGFTKMVEDAKAGKFDLMITKSFTRFARNTVDSIETVRLFSSLGIDIYFEDKCLHSLDQKGEIMVTLYSAFAQEELRNLSQNTAWGYQKKFERGEPLVSNLLGYDSKHCDIKINLEEAIVVRLINQLFLEGYSLYAIKRELESRGIKTKRGKDTWQASTIRGILNNEKYAGNAMLQKTVTLDFMTKTRVKNTGQKKSYYVENTHPAIISPEIHRIVIDEIKNREMQSAEQKKNDKREEVRMSLDNNCNYSSKYYLSNILSCEDCNNPFRRYTWTARGTTKYVWMCKVRKQKDGRKQCPLSPSIEEKDLHLAILHAINTAAKKVEIPAASDYVNENVHQNMNKIVEAETELANLTKRLSEAYEKNESNNMILDIKTELSICSLELVKYKFLNDQINNTKEALNQTSISLKEYSDDLVKLYIRSIKVTNKGNLIIQFKSGLEMTVSCKCTLAS